MCVKFALEKLNTKILFFRSPADLVDKKIIYSVCGFRFREFNTANYRTLVSISPLCKPPHNFCTEFPSISHKEEDRWRRDSSGANDRIKLSTVIWALCQCFERRQLIRRSKPTSLGQGNLIWIRTAKFKLFNQEVYLYKISEWILHRFCISFSPAESWWNSLCNTWKWQL